MRESSDCATQRARHHNQHSYLSVCISVYLHCVHTASSLSLLLDWKGTKKNKRVKSLVGLEVTYDNTEFQFVYVGLTEEHENFSNLKKQKLKLNYETRRLRSIYHECWSLMRRFCAALLRAKGSSNYHLKQTEIISRNVLFHFRRDSLMTRLAVSREKRQEVCVCVCVKMCLCAAQQDTNKCTLFFLSV